MGRDRRSASDWLAHNTHLVTGGLAVFCVVAVGLIAFYDQLLGTERWCYLWLDTGGTEQRTCRDNERSCSFDRRRRCDEDPRAAVSPCHAQDDAPPALERCRP